MQAGPVGHCRRRGAVQGLLAGSHAKPWRSSLPSMQLAAGLLVAPDWASAPPDTHASLLPTGFSVEPTSSMILPGMMKH